MTVWDWLAHSVCLSARGLRAEVLWLGSCPPWSAGRLASAAGLRLLELGGRLQDWSLRLSDAAVREAEADESAGEGE